MNKKVIFNFVYPTEKGVKTEIQDIYVDIKEIIEMIKSITLGQDVIITAKVKGEDIQCMVKVLSVHITEGVVIVSGFSVNTVRVKKKDKKPKTNIKIH